MRHILAPLLVLSAFALVVNCGSSNGSGNAANGNATTTATCQNDNDVTPYSAGMKKAGDSNVFTFVLDSASPAPPAQNLNTWTMHVLDGSGSALANANVSLTPFMPTMGHGSSQTPQVAVDGNAYVISNINLFMPGLWSMTVTAKANNQTDSALFYFCIN